MKTFTKMPGTVGGAADAHLPERHEGKDGYACKACLKFTREPTGGFCAPAEVVPESGPKGPAYGLNALKSQFRRVDE